MSTIYLASDSTVQTYPKEQYPQTGWGQVFYKFFKGKDNCKIYVRPDAPASHITTYELPDISIENHAFAARSSRSFIEQGRLDQIGQVAKPGDFLMVQFAHNDAYEAREERFVPVDKFGEWLLKYKTFCDDRNITCIFVTPVSMRVYDEEGVCHMAFKEYRDEMIETSNENHIPCIDLSGLSTNLFNDMGPEKTRDVFLWLYPGEYPDGAFKDGAKDNAHFQEYGATLMASLIAKAIREDSHPELAPIRECLESSVEIPCPVRHYPEGFVWEEDSDMLKAAAKDIVNRN